MSKTIVVTVYKDNNGEFPSGKKLTISAASKVDRAGSINLDFVGDFNVDYNYPVTDVLRIYEPNKGIIYIGETLAEFNSLVDGANKGTDRTKQRLIYVGAGLDMEVGATVYNPIDGWLKNITIHDITYLKETYKDFYSGSPEIAHDKVAGTLDFEPSLGVNGVQVEDYISITYNE